MKNFQNYTPEKYGDPEFQKVEEGIYRTKNPYSSGAEEVYVTSLSFEMEPECYGEEGGCPQDITQVPFEDILDEFFVFVTDFYDELNAGSEVTCYQEFGSWNLADIQKLRTIIGKRVYAAPYENEADGETYHNLVIE